MGKTIQSAPWLIVFVSMRDASLIDMQNYIFLFHFIFSLAKILVIAVFIFMKNNDNFLHRPDILLYVLT